MLAESASHFSRADGNSMKVKISRARIRADKALSDYIRQLWADPMTEMATCVSCGTSKHWTEMDCGHFIPKSRANAIRYDTHNVHPQCPGCNRFDAETAKIGYTQWMLDHYGSDTVRRLQEASRETVRFRVSDYLQFESEFKARLAELLEMRRVGLQQSPRMPELLGAVE